MNAFDFSAELFAMGEQGGDEEFLDFLTYRMMTLIATLEYRAYPPPSSYRYGSPDEDARRQIEAIGEVATARFDRLYAKSPDTYIRHAEYILSLMEPFEFGWRRGPPKHNAIWTYLTEKYQSDWQRSPRGITELMESPHINVQIAALRMLAAGGEHAAPRVIENLPAFRALLLSNTYKGTKRLALACLKAAAREDHMAAEHILPLLKETVDFDARRAISDDIAVAMIQLQDAE